MIHEFCRRDRWPRDNFGKSMLVATAAMDALGLGYVVSEGLQTGVVGLWAGAVGGVAVTGALWRGGAEIVARHAER